jgi:hypothetical protein
MMSRGLILKVQVVAMAGMVDMVEDMTIEGGMVVVDTTMGDTVTVVMIEVDRTVLESLGPMTRGEMVLIDHLLVEESLGRMTLGEMVLIDPMIQEVPMSHPMADVVAMIRGVGTLTMVPLQEATPLLAIHTIVGALPQRSVRLLMLVVVVQVDTPQSH